MALSLPLTWKHSILPNVVSIYMILVIVYQSFVAKRHLKSDTYAFVVYFIVMYT